MIIKLEGGVSAVPGFLTAGVRAGIKTRGLDMMLLVNQDGPVPAAGAFTTNLIKGAPLIVTKEHLRNDRLAAIVANSGCANTYTGERGIRDARKMASLVAKDLGLRTTDVAVASTGLIGMPFPIPPIKAGIKACIKKLSGSRESGSKAARAIMTTDSFPKQVAIKTKLEDGTPVAIAGIAKGAGMIRPRLRTATMLAFLVTDAAVSSVALRAALQKSIDRSFNMITVDNDTSTNDMVLLMANGRAQNRMITELDGGFQAGLDRVTSELAQLIVRDGEGSTRLIEVQVKNSRSFEDARKAALAVAGSNLVKAMVFGGDPNWGRIVTALGYSGARFDPSKINLEIASERGSVKQVKRGRSGPKRAIERARGLMRGREIKFSIDLGAGKSSATAWGCDLTYNYVKKNAKYTT